jgi:hypothetical protein
VFRRILAAALALTMGLATVPAFADGFDSLTPYNFMGMTKDQMAKIEAENAGETAKWRAEQPERARKAKIEQDAYVARTGDDSSICLNGQATLYRLPSNDFAAIGRAARTRAARLGDAVRTLGRMANNHATAALEHESIIDPNDPADGPCAEAVQLLIDYVEGK